ncbi:TolC family protein [Jiulongibacter sediminis]|uniref:Transporter n=1 Tax=Jiulongibacter sediminis TaxID=1605367 RepID=A0A0P7BMN1_9BACT|nr:TolC family protein [Jiulongibacter sediminis]KPM46579.1 hypothetical protein AFM12_19165 [Jiulongibacter sediminis]TBX21152.1 hypothetical protein TK44_19170 [Jiulongibacter sediminis]
MKKLIYRYMFLLTVVIPVHGQTLEEYLLMAAENNPDIQAAHSEFNAALQRIAQVNALPDPTVSLGVFVSPIETRVGAQRARLSLNQMFPWFGTLKAREEAAGLMAQAKFGEINVLKNDLFLALKQNYFPLAEIKEHIRISEENLEILQTYKLLSTAKYSNGKVPLSDVLRVDIMIENLRTEISLLRENIKPYEVNINRLLNRSDSLSIHIEPRFTQGLTGIDSEPIEDLVDRNPSLLLVDAKIEAEKANENLAKLRYKPNLGVGLDYAMISKRKEVEMAQNGKDVLMPMVSISLPIFKKKNAAYVEESKLMQMSLSQKREGIENKLKGSYAMAFFELEKALELFQHYQNQIEKNQRIQNLLYTAYANSGENFEEVLRIQQETLRYEMAKASATKNYYLSLAKLESLTASDL